MGPILAFFIFCFIIQILIPIIGCCVIGMTQAFKDLGIKSRNQLAGWLLVPGYPIMCLIMHAFNYLAIKEKRREEEEKE